MREPLKEFKKDYALTAAGCNAQKQLPLSELVRQIIETATSHANLLGIGYLNLIKDNRAWVLGRLTIEINRMPEMHQSYSLKTWIEGFNRHFSKRNFELANLEGENIGYATTVWSTINPETRQPADLSSIENIDELILARTIPIEPQSRIKPVENPEIEKVYPVQTTDIDFNRHVTTAKYVELAENQLPLDFYDNNSLVRFEMSFHQEAKWGERLQIQSSFLQENILSTEIKNEAGISICSCKMIFREKNRL